MTRTGRAGLAALVLLGATTAAAVSLFAGDGTAAPAAPRVAHRPATGQYGENYAEVTVVMKDNDYLPQTLTVDPGTVVKWTNEGRSKHNVIPDQASTGWKSPTIKPKKSFEQKLDKPGAYGYFCTFHGAPGKGMYGTLIVKNADGTIPPVKLARSKRVASGKPRTIKVPQDVKKIQTAVDSAPPGSLILVSPGVYKEAVTVTTDRLVIRGLDRNKVILDGGYQARQRHQGARRERGRGREHDRAKLHEERLLLDGREGLPRLVPDLDAHRRLRHLRVRLDRRDLRPSLRLGLARRGLLHRPVLPVQRGRSRTWSLSTTGSASRARTRAATSSS